MSKLVVRRPANGKTIVAAAIMLLAIAAVASALQAPPTQASGARAAGHDYGGFLPNIYLQLFKWCKNTPQGTTCADVSQNCVEPTDIGVGNFYFAYLEINDVTHNGNVDVSVFQDIIDPTGRDWCWAPDCRDENEAVRLRFGGNPPGVCAWIVMDRTDFSNPAGTWKHRFKLVDNIRGDFRREEKNIEIKCVNNANCAPGYKCENSLCVAAPDLVVERLRTIPFPPRTGENTMIEAFIKNIGAASFTQPPLNPIVLFTQFKLDNQNPREKGNAVSLNPGEAYQSYDDRTETEGPHTTYAKADFNNTLAEAREDNNVREEQITWVVDRPDLQATNLSVSPTPVYSGSPFNITFKVVDGGGRTVTTPFSVKLFLDDREIQNYTIFAISPLFDTTIYYTVYDFLFQGQHSFKVKVDARNEIRESDENNDFTFSFTVNKPQPLSQSITGLQPEYVKGDEISFVLAVRDTNNQPVADATFYLSDPFKQMTVLKPGAGGVASYATQATTTGLHRIEVFASKRGYSTDKLVKLVKVLDFNGRINAVVTRANGEAVGWARVYKNGVLTAVTNSKGEAQVLADKGPATIRIECSDSILCTQQDVQITTSRSEQYVNTKCNCRKASLRVDVDTNDGRSIANALVLVDEQEAGATNPFGYVYLKDAGMGNKTIKVFLNVTDGNGTALYLAERRSDLNKPDNVLKFTLSQTTSGLRMNAQENGAPAEIEFRKVESTVIPLAVVAVGALAVLDLVSTTLDVNDLCNCIVKNADAEVKYGDCVSAVDKVIKSDNVTKELTNHMRGYKLGEGACIAETGFLIVDVIGVGVPLGVAKATLLGLGLVSVVHLIDEVTVFLWKNADGTFRYVNKFGERIGKKAQDGLSFIVRPFLKKLDWQKISESAAGKFDQTFFGRAGQPAKDQMERAFKDMYGDAAETQFNRQFEGLGKLKEKKIPGVDFSAVDNGAKSLVDEIASNSEQLSKHTASGKLDDAKRAKGQVENVLNELEVLTRSKYIGRLTAARKTVFGKSGEVVTEFDGVLDNKHILEAWRDEILAPKHPLTSPEFYRQYGGLFDKITKLKRGRALEMPADGKIIVEFRKIDATAKNAIRDYLEQSAKYRDIAPYIELLG